MCDTEFSLFSAVLLMSFAAGNVYFPLSCKAGRDEKETGRGLEETRLWERGWYTYPSCINRLINETEKNRTTDENKDSFHSYAERINNNFVKFL